MSTEEGNEIEQVRGALTEIRREGLKAAFLHAGIESALVLLGSTFLFSRLGVASGRYTTELSPAVAETLTDLFATLGSSYSVEAGMTMGLARSTALAFVVTAVFFALDLGVTYRLRTVEAFESINPEVEEALRTARDTSMDGETNTMARELYDDVIARLKETSSSGFVSRKRLLGNLAAVLLIGVILIVVSSLSLSLGGLGGSALFGGGGGGGGGEGATQQEGGQSTEYSGLQDPDEVLGEEGGVGSGGEDQGIQLDRGGSGGTAGGSGGYADNFEGSGGGSVEAQRSGYSSGDQVEDSELVKEYNLRIRGER